MMTTEGVKAFIGLFCLIFWEVKWVFENLFFARRPANLAFLCCF